MHVAYWVHLGFCSTAALDCHAAQNMGRMQQKELLFLLILLGLQIFRIHSMNSYFNERLFKNPHVRKIQILWTWVRQKKLAGNFFLAKAFVR